MKSLVGPRIAVTLDYDRDVTASFSGDDADRFSLPFDLGDIYNNIAIESPALDASATVGIQRLNDKPEDNPTEIPVPIEYQKTDNTTAVWTRTAATTVFSRNTVHTGPMQYGRIKVSADQIANRIFYVQGYD